MLNKPAGAQAMEAATMIGCWEGEGEGLGVEVRVSAGVGMCLRGRRLLGL